MAIKQSGCMHVCMYMYVHEKMTLNMTLLCTLSEVHMGIPEGDQTLPLGAQVPAVWKSRSEDQGSGCGVVEEKRRGLTVTGHLVWHSATF